MKRPTVLIIAPEDDLHARAVARVLEQKRVNVECVDLGTLDIEPRLSLSVSPDLNALLRTRSGKATKLSEVDTVWWRRPRIPETSGFAEDQREFVRSEWEHFSDGLEFFANVRWVNVPRLDSQAHRKALQLTAARAVDLRVPATTITNDPEAVRSLLAEHAPLIYKRIGTARKPAIVTRELLEPDVGRLDALPSCPAIFQEKIEARLDVRITAIGGTLYAAEIDSQRGSAPLDWRLDLTVPFRPHTLDSDVAARVGALLERLGLVYAAIDMRLTPTNEYVFLELNPAGQYLFVELLTGIPLTARMAEFLAGV